MRITPGKMMAALLLVGLVVGAYRFGKTGGGDPRYPGLRSNPGPYQQTGQGLNPLQENQGQIFGQQQPNVNNFLAPNAALDSPSQYNDLNRQFDLLLNGSATRAPSLEDQRQAFLNTIKKLEMMDDHNQGFAPQKLPEPDPSRESYLMDSIDNLMQIHGINQYLYFHGEQKRMPFTPTDYSKTPPPEPKYAYVIDSEKLAAPKLLPTLGNGHIATVVDSPDIFMNGLYNGKLSVSHRARIPSMVAFRISSINPPADHQRIYSMDFGDGVWRETWRSSDYVVEKTSYVHRFYQRIIVCEVDVFRLKNKTATQLPLRINMELKGGSSKDITFSEGKCGLANCVYIYGKTIDNETPKSKKLDVHIYYNPLYNGIDVPVPTDVGLRHKYYFYAAISPDAKDAYNAFKEARQAIEKNNLLSQHIAAWRSLWSHSAVTMEGNPVLQKAITSSFYYIYCSMPFRNDTVAPFTGLSPTDLGHGTSLEDYRGHVFWDQEIWVMPSLLLFKPYLAKLIMFSRARVVEAAYDNAKRNHYRGTQFPWEAAYTGAEMAPDFRRNYTLYNHHINGDLAFAMSQYAYITKDKSLFEDIRYKKVLNGAATFWDSRLEWDKRKNKYVINNVMGPDEYQPKVNNSAYTNLIAKMAMQAPYKVFDYLGLPCEVFKSVHDKAEEVYQPFDKANMYHPEFEGYKIGTKVKQADVILMNYPLGLEMSTVIKRRDITIYEKVTEKEGPAMTYSMFAIGYLSLRDYANAERMLNKTMMHIKPPYGVWSELRNGGGAVNFITGAGGFLQTILYGYAGIRIKQHYLEINPVLPPLVTAFNITGFKYQGGTFNLQVLNTTMYIQQVRSVTPAIPFKVRLSTTKQDKELFPGRRVVFPRVQVALMQVYGIGATVHNEKTEVNPRKPSGRLIVEPPKLKEKPAKPDHKSVWGLQNQFVLPVGGSHHAPGQQRDSGLAPPKIQFSQKKDRLVNELTNMLLPPKPTPQKVEDLAPVPPAHVTKPAPKPAPKPAAKPATKPAPKPAAKPASKPAAKPAPKPAAKPAPAPKPPAPKPQSAADRAKSARLKALSRFGGRKL